MQYYSPGVHTWARIMYLPGFSFEIPCSWIPITLLPACGYDLNRFLSKG